MSESVRAYHKNKKVAIASTCDEKFSNINVVASVDLTAANISKKVKKRSSLIGKIYFM
jgi:hypothetical protein